MSATAAEQGGSTKESWLSTLARDEIDDLIKRAKARHADEGDAYSDVLRRAYEIGFNNQEPGKTVLELFLGNQADKWEVSLPKLFAEDTGARARVYSEAIRRSLSALTDKEKGQVNGFGVWAPRELDRRIKAAVDPIITIKQGNYSHRGWQGALGTYNIHWSVVGASQDGRRIFVKLEGKGQYEWSPHDASRHTVELHRIARRLIDLGRAKALDLPGPPATFTVDIAAAQLIDPATGQVLAKLEGHRTQVDPKRGGENVLQDITGQGVRALRSRASETVEDLARESRELFSRLPGL